MGKQCICERNHCAVDGKCVPRQWGCKLDTGGSCSIMGCDRSRGAVCIGTVCMCRDGFCAKNGMCTPESSLNTSSEIMHTILPSPSGKAWYLEGATFIAVLALSF